MDNQTLRTKLNELVAADANIATMVAIGNATGVAGAVNALGSKRPRQYLITKRGILKALGAHEGRVFIQTLRAVSALLPGLTTAHPAYDDVWWLSELLGDLEPGGGGIDVGDAETRAALRALAGPLGAALSDLLAAGLGVTTGHCDALDAASSDDDTVSDAQVSQVLNEGL